MSIIYRCMSTIFYISLHNLYYSSFSYVNLKPWFNFWQNSLAQMENWVLCRLFLKKGDVKDNDMLIQTSTNNKVENVGVAQPRFFDFMMGYKTSLPLASSTSSSSGSNTSAEVSSSGADYEESSACTHY